MKTILVTGGAGYIGSAVAVTLWRAGHEVVVLDDLSIGQGAVLPSEIKLLQGDVCNWAELSDLTAPYDFDVVIHCAAKKAVGESELKPTLYFHTNVLGSLNILRLVEKCGIPQLIFSSTAAVYDTRAMTGAVTESSPLGAPNVYGTTKQIVEEAVRAYARTARLNNYTIFRYFNVAGDIGLRFRDEAAQNVFPLLARAAATGSTFSIFGTDYDTRDGTGVRDYIHLGDLVEAHLLALENPISGIYNLGTGRGYSVRELIAAFDAALSRPLIVAEAPRRAGDPPSLVADATWAEVNLGWKPRFTLGDMVESTLATYV